MESLKKLTPEQIAVLTPECLTILLNANAEGKEKDITKLKGYFDAYTRSNDNVIAYTNGSRTNGNIHKMSKILSKYPDDKFYVFAIKYIVTKDAYRSEKFSIYLESEVKNGDVLLGQNVTSNSAKGGITLPTGTDLNKFCFTTGRHMLGIFYPDIFPKSPSHKKPVLTYIEELPFFCGNVYLVHPILWDFAQHLHS